MEWLWILVVLGLGLWNLQLHAANQYLRRQLEWQALQNQLLYTQANSGVYQDTTGCLDTLLWLGVAGLIALILFGASL
ncbi:MAG: hypothetical protein N2559_16835 [Anaerolineae bacterium]|nr:hypothetical protein [Anaerolineae bacterium]